MVDESHMAVEYCRSSSGALSFRSSVSIATRTLDTWLGLSERANQKQAVYNTTLEDASRKLCLEINVWIQFPNATISSVLPQRCHVLYPLNPFNWPQVGSSFPVFVRKLQQHSYHISENKIGEIHSSRAFSLIWIVLQLTGSQLEYHCCSHSSHIFPHQTVPFLAKVSHSVECVFRRKKREGAEEGCRKQSICMQSHKSEV